MRPVDADALVEQLSDKAKEMLGIAEQCQGLAINYYEGAKYGFAKAAIIANGLPTIEPKKGRCTNESRYFHCSVCDYGVQDVFEGSGKKGAKTTYVFENGGEWNYCPNCGAKMERSEE